jgi:hypothetical protein
MALVIDIARLKIITYRAIKTTGTLIVITGLFWYVGGESNAAKYCAVLHKYFEKRHCFN